SSWGIGTTPSASNPEGKIPTAADDFHYGVDHNWRTSFWMDLGGTARALRSIVWNESEDYSSRQRYWHLRNGELSFSGSVSNISFRIFLDLNAKLVFGQTSVGCFGKNAGYTQFEIADGCELDLLGDMCIKGLKIVNKEGGKLVFNPSRFYTDQMHKDSVRDVENHGTFDAPNGIDFFGTTSNDRILSFRQLDGTMNLGGPVSTETKNAKLQFELGGGTLNVTGDAGFYGDNTIAVMNDNVTATVCVSENATFDNARMTYGADTVLTKTGPGVMKMGAALPKRFNVVAGTLSLTESVNLGSALVLGEGTVLHIGAAGVSADAIEGLASATVTFADSLLAKSGTIVFSSQNKELLETIASKVNAASSGVTFEVGNGNILVTDIGTHEPMTFSWKNKGKVSSSDLFSWVVDGKERWTWCSFLDPDSWSVGLDPAGSNSSYLVPGAEDSIYIGATSYAVYAMDMCGLGRRVRNLELSLDAEGRYPEQAWQRIFLVRNGSLEFTGSFTNVNVLVRAMDGGEFVLGRNSSSRLGYKGAGNWFRAENGGTVELLGSIDAHCMKLEVEEGGKAVFDPVAFSMCANHGSGVESKMESSGTLNLPNGFLLRESVKSSDAASFDIVISSGTVNLGGPVEKDAAAKMPLRLSIDSCTLNATANVSFGNLDSATVANGAEILATVAENAVLDLSAVTFGEGTTFVRNGKGRIVFGASRPSHYTRTDRKGMVFSVR
ncbi:MAG: hypothetical protein IKK82_06590, partial [Kiritimatiellae bacterium]|nr:hypothetical protein [Kiritimatiellia bacterium]